MENEDLQRRMQADPEAQQRAMEQKREQEERRQHIILQILTHDARERLSRIAMVKPDKARQIEDMLVNAAQTGRLSEKVDEQKLISLLEQISEKAKKTTVIMKRRTIEDDD
ncbi:hypothetical protein DFA_03096 [Cavenderia fasciculata]|uniref:DNA-binding protein n=1 Tax=Cavenderia fasciculata TaxID=261658 RepID=F4PGL7_CACFS|nr:uncharacterized protein DFA_03096 [Cavenderia fasciculata]EGG24851.1 hypothetical protein DFA_03096 [Cavenderia fasciculata]|eukprot:XP_004362702.1 hypothetical protein DFA_03096 [Cavenderia fasciculata]